MFPILWTILCICGLLFSMYVVYKRRKKEGIKGFKTLIPSACFFLIALVNLFAYWLDLLGIFSWLLTIMLLFVGAYFTKYLPPKMAKTNG